MLDGHNSAIAGRVSSQQARRLKAGLSVTLCIIISKMNSSRCNAQIDIFFPSDE